MTCRGSLYDSLINIVKGYPVEFVRFDLFSVIRVL